jgi:hypothetical protein
MAKNGNIHPTRVFKSADELLSAWNEYKRIRDDEAKKWAKIQYVGKNGTRVEDYPPMPYVLDGFVSWYKDEYGHYIHQYFKNPSAYGDDFLTIVTHIIAERDNNIQTGTLLGFYNASMGNRIVGLADKKEVEHSGGLNIPNLPDIGTRK